MKRSVYLETSVISYLTAGPSRDLVKAARQEITREWWRTQREGFDLYVSGLVVEEAARGDADAARDRLAAISGIPSVELDDEVGHLSRALVREGLLPAKAADDATHLAAATVAGVDFLLTWNLGHLANPHTRDAISLRLRELGYDPPVVCTPDELQGEPS